MKPTPLLNNDGTASMATMLMASHQAFRRDIARFRRALGALDPKRVPALRDEWTAFSTQMRNHHKTEDETIFPQTRIKHGELATTVVKLSDQQRKIDPLLQRGDRAFAALPNTANVVAVLGDLETLLDAHLDLKEATVIPTLRGSKELPAVDVDGFAWSTHGVAADVLAKLDGMLPPALVEKLPEARAKFAARCERVWGSAAAGATTTSIPA